MVPEAVTAGLESNDNAFDSADERRILRGSRKLARLALDHTAVAKSHDQFRSYGIRLWSGLSLVSGAGLRGGMKSTSRIAPVRDQGPRL